MGVEIHEGPNATPSNDKPLPAGAVISAEPGIYLPGKLGVRIEDVLYLTPEGCQNLTLAPKAVSYTHLMPRKPLHSSSYVRRSSRFRRKEW